MTTRLVFDIEANGLLYDASRIWCICCKDLSDNQTYKFYGDSIEEGLTFLSSYDMIIGHNITGYDIPLIQKLYPGWEYNKIRDSYVMSKLFNPERPQGHSLESYGEQFGRVKPVHEDWTQFSDEMLYRCSEDVEINCLTYNCLVDSFCRNWSWLPALELEQEFALLQAYQELAGVDFDSQLARDLLARIDQEVDELDKILLDRIPKQVEAVGAVVSKPFKKDGSYSKMVTEWFNL